MTTKQKEFIIHYSGEVHTFLPDASKEVAIFIACQFALESDYGTSELFRENNNICGMKVAKIRPSAGSFVTSCKYQSFSYYPSVYYSILDFCYWLCYNRITKEVLDNVSKYCRFLILSKYCPEKDYINKIQSIYQQFKSKLNG